MVYGEPRCGFDIADWARRRTDGERQFELGLRGLIVGFPATLRFAVCEFAIQVVKNAFNVLPIFGGGGVENELVLMFGACRRDYAGVFFDAPAQFLDPPPLLHVFIKMLDDSRKTNLCDKLADGMDGCRKDDSGDDVGWGKDTGRCSVGAGLQGALHREGTGKVNGPREIGIGVGTELVLDASKGTVGCRGKMAREEVGEGETVFPGLVANGFSDENPFFEFIPFDRAIEAVFEGWLFEDDVPEKHHFKLLQHDFSFQDRKLELAGKDSSRRTVWRAVKDKRRGFIIDVQLCHHWGPSQTVFRSVLWCDFGDWR